MADSNPLSLKGESPSDEIQTPARSVRGRRPVVSHPFAIVALVLAASFFARDLLAALSSTTAEAWTDSDIVVNVWTTWWVESVLRGAANLFRTEAILVPFGADLRLHAYGPLLGLLAAPFTRGLGYVGATNIAIVVTLVLNGVVTYWLLDREIRQRGAALVGAAFLMLATPVTAELFEGRTASASLWTIAATLGCAGSLLDRPRIWSAGGLALSLTAALLADAQLFLSALLWLAIYLPARFNLEGRGLRRLAVLVGATLVGVAPFLIFYVPALVEAPAAGYALQSVSALAAQSYELGDYIQPSLVQTAYGYEFLIVSLVTLAIFWWRQEYRMWLVGAVIFVGLALGPRLESARISLPLALGADWPLLAIVDAPHRFMLPAILGFSVVAAFLCARIFHRLPTRKAVAPLAVAVVGARLAAAVLLDAPEVQRFPSYETYRRIAADRQAAAILEVPVGVRSASDRIGGSGDSLQFYQPVHGKRILNGQVTRMPAAVFEFYRSHPVLRFLSGEGLPTSNDVLDRDFADLLHWSRVRYVILHRGLLPANRDELIEAFLHRQSLLERQPDEADLVVFRVSRVP